MQDILVLLQHLAENEETTIKLIIDCLYDVGAVNFINRKVQNPAINQFTKSIASLSKPVAKRFGLYWFKKNCPELIVNWLQRKVAFPPPQKAPLPKTEAENQADIIKVVEVAEVQAQLDGLPSVETLSQPLDESHHQSIGADPSPITGEDNSQLTAGLDSTGEDPSNPAVSFTPLSLENLPILLDASVADRANSDQTRIASTQTTVGEGSTDELKQLSSAISELEQSTHSAIEHDANSGQDLPFTVPVSPVDSVLPYSTEVRSRQLPGVSAQMEPETRQIRRLQSQVKVLTGILVGTTLMSGVAIWHLHTTPRNVLDLQRSIPSPIVPPE